MPKCWSTKTWKKLPKINTSQMHSLIHTKKFFYFLKPIKIFWVYHWSQWENWYMGLYHAQSSLVWNSQFQARLKYGKYVKLKYLDWPPGCKQTSIFVYIYHTSCDHFSCKIHAHVHKINKINVPIQSNGEYISNIVHGKTLFETHAGVQSPGDLQRVPWAARGGLKALPRAWGGWNSPK